MDERAGGENWYKTSDPEGSDDTSQPQSAAVDVPGERAVGEVEWTATEFVEHHKPAVWYLVLAIITIAIAALVFYAGRDYVSTVAIILIGIIFGVIGSRKPRDLEYRLDKQGLTVMNRLYPYHRFKAFSVEREGGVVGFGLLPLKRFMPVMTIYCDLADEEKISAVLGDYLPLDNRSKDVIDKFLHKIRF